ncbi:MAG TPA: proton-conducting transporter membrane subunit, partial [Planctomycetaceae bacterium]|nr:proton-conducting transporter membrane subunit [Planctomycetaceae bacterium]
AALFFVSAFSLAGVPPLSGFFAKLILVRAGLEARQYAIVATALAVGLLTLYSMTKIWNEAFWKPRELPPDGPGDPVAASLPAAAAAAGESDSFADRAGAFLPMAGLAALTVAIGLACGPLFALATSAAEQLLDSSQYIRAVLGDVP